MFGLRKAHSHHRPQLLARGRGTQAFWAKSPDGTLVVFVHGFRGSAVKTWKAFQRVIPGTASPGTDLIFYGYDGFGAHIVNSAVLLREFLEVVVNRPDDLPSAPIVRNRDFAYSRIVLVAHSMGAIVVRRALLQLLRRTKSELPVRLVFFAPAHSGARVAVLLEELGSFSSWGHRHGSREVPRARAG